MGQENRFGTDAAPAQSPVGAAPAPGVPPRMPSGPAPNLSRAAKPRDSGELKLLRYRVTNYRSVADSGWLDVDRVTALIGVNESGKTNLLMPLWKLNPASGGEIAPTSDYPKALFATIRAEPGAFQFINAEFDTGIHAETLAALARISPSECRKISVARLYDGSYRMAFPDHHSRPDESARAALAALEVTRNDLNAVVAPPGQEPLLAAARRTLAQMADELRDVSAITGNDLRLARNAVSALIPEDPPATSPVIPHLRSLQKSLGVRMAEMIAPDPAARDDLRDAVLTLLPSFVYYSNYGNLDSEIYLPHVVENLGRGDLGAKESAKARTLKVLFDFVGLQAREVLELGRDFRDIRDEAEALRIAAEGKVGLIRSIWSRAVGPQPQPDAEILSKIAEAKRTRSILLQSAGTKLTERFADWWKQGDYRFRCEADGNHFRIWVSDSRRPQEVELEHRSTGLQWFLSFFLVFLHEARSSHANSVLLLDEPGHSLHPLAQRDLSAFFEALALSNQMIYTTHSPFLVDADRLGRARKVYVDTDGSTRVSGDLMDPGGSGKASESQRGAAYAVRAAVNMAVAEAGLAGARPVLVPSRIEQTYLAAIKTLCIAAGRFQPKRELIFAPAAGAQVMHAVASILGGVGATAPKVVVDTEAGAAMTEGTQTVALDALTGIPGATIEDLISLEPMAAAVDRVERRPERLFSDIVRADRPFVAQVRDWADSEGIKLAENWRMQLAERMRDRMLVQDRRLPDGAKQALWLTLMQMLDAESGAGAEAGAGEAQA